MRREVGFTLIELMIVVAVVAILALIALPMYTEQMRKGKRAEAAQALGDMQLRQESWRADHPTYGDARSTSPAAPRTRTAYNNGAEALHGQRVAGTRRPVTRSPPRARAKWPTIPSAAISR